MSAPDSGAGPTHPPGHPGTGSPPPPPPPKDCDCGHGDLPQTFHLTPCPNARPLRLPALAQVVGDATKVLNAAIVMLGRQWDPTTGPQQDGGVLPSEVDAALGAARTNIRIALLDLGDAAAMIPARQSTNSASLPGGPLNHPDGSRGEGLTPGLDVGAGIAPEGSEQPLVGLPAGSSHLTRTSPRASGGLLPGLVDAASHPTAGGTDGSEAAAPSRDAGESSDPGLRRAQRAPDGNGVTPGVGQFCERHFSWLCQAGQGECQRQPDEQHSDRPGVGFTVPQAKAFDIRQGKWWPW